MLDETCVKTILTRYFPTATEADICEAARDVVLLELLVDDRVLAWEDALRDRREPGWMEVFMPSRRPAA